jgi:hypothetical protein
VPTATATLGLAVALVLLGRATVDTTPARTTAPPATTTVSGTSADGSACTGYAFPATPC